MSGSEAGAGSAPSVEADLSAAVEAILFAAGEPISADRIAEGIGGGASAARAALDALRAAYASRPTGLQIVEIAGGWQIATRPEQSGAVERALRRTRKVRLTRAALETLSIIAYRQPVTRAEVETIRGVNVDGVMRTLLERDLVRITGKKEEPGSPLLYGTTQEFLLHFGLRAVDDLPPLRELEEIARALPEGEEAVAGDADLEAAAAERRARLQELASAAERELGDIEGRLKAVKVPSAEDLAAAAAGPGEAPSAEAGPEPSPDPTEGA